MQLSYKGQEKVQAPPAAVWAFVQDPERVAQCLPEVQDMQLTGPNQLTASVQIGSGLIRSKLKFNIEVRPDESAQRVNVTIRGGGLGNALDVTASADIRGEPDATTILDWRGEADLRGPLVNASGRVLETQAQKLIARTFQNVAKAVMASSNTLA